MQQKDQFSIFQEKGGREMRTILVVDDEEEIREILKQFFTDLDFNVVVCENGARAVPRIEEADILVTDFNMPPGINGGELAEIAKQQKPGIRVIIMTGISWDVPSDHLADVVIEKPFNLEALERAVKG